MIAWLNCQKGSINFHFLWGLLLDLPGQHGIAFVYNTAYVSGYIIGSHCVEIMQVLQSAVATLRVCIASSQ